MNGGLSLYQLFLASHNCIPCVILPFLQAKLKSRVLSQIVSPASSTYIYDNMCLRSDDIEFRENRPAVGVMRTVNGFTLCQVSDVVFLCYSSGLTLLFVIMVWVTSTLI